MTAPDRLDPGERVEQYRAGAPAPSAVLGLAGEFARQRAEALTRTCPYCSAGVGEPCRNQNAGRGYGLPLVRLPAHDRRIHPRPKDRT